ncbi:hypothetical protein JB92DRAFT_3141271 [Gautieria morchelliformis]|nr:hypothetical protein JB92DRAFT_3141271 [Gautieria morchelliformis]
MSANPEHPADSAADQSRPSAAPVIRWKYKTPHHSIERRLVPSVALSLVRCQHGTTLYIAILTLQKGGPSPMASSPIFNGVLQIGYSLLKGGRPCSAFCALHWLVCYAPSAAVPFAAALFAAALFAAALFAAALFTAALFAAALFAAALFAAALFAAALFAAALFAAALFAAALFAAALFAAALFAAALFAAAPFTAASFPGS